MIRYIDLEDVADTHEILTFELIFEMLTGIIRQINNFVKNNKNDEFLIYAFLFLHLCSANKKVCFYRQYYVVVRRQHENLNMYILNRT